MDAPGRRTAISPGRLYSLLAGEFKELRSPECVGCRMPLPILIERPDSVSANWKIGTPPPCAHGCDRLISEIAAKAWPLYDLLDPLSKPLPAEGQRAPAAPSEAAKGEA